MAREGTEELVGEEKIKYIEEIRDRLVELNCPVLNLNRWIEQLKYTLGKELLEVTDE